VVLLRGGGIQEVFTVNSVAVYRCSYVATFKSKVGGVAGASDLLIGGVSGVHRRGRGQGRAGQILGQKSLLLKQKERLNTGGAGECGTPFERKETTIYYCTHTYVSREVSWSVCELAVAGMTGEVTGVGMFKGALERVDWEVMGGVCEGALYGVTGRRIV
jgi:hypothetical protein